MSDNKQSKQSKSRKQSKFLLALKPFLAFVPQIEAPAANETLNLQDKLVWTLGGLIIFLIASGTPLFGVPNIQQTLAPDPLYWFRPILASKPLTLMELGISPIVTSGLVLQLLAGSKMIYVDQNNKSEKALFQATQKLFAILITVGEAIAFIASGIYGHWYYDLGIICSLLIFVQLFISSVIVILLDEIIQIGYGMGNGGVSLFIATNICTNIIWKTLSPITVDTSTGIQYEGAIIALFHLLLTRKSFIRGLKEAFYRRNLPNITNLFATIIMFIIVIYFQGFRIDLPVKSTKLRGTHGQTKYPIKLFYTSNIPIILYTALVSNVFFISQILSNRFGSNILTNIFGKWKIIKLDLSKSYSVPVGGLVYYMSPPQNIRELLFDPIHSILYLIFILITCLIFSLTWINVSGSSSKDVAKQLKEQGLVIRGFREHATYEVLQRYIPAAAAFGGVAIALLTVIADFVGAIGTGSGILLAVTIIFEIFESYVREAQAQGMQLNMPKMNW